jgi:uncharacterized protein
VQQEIQHTFGVPVDYIVLDLSAPGSSEALYRQTAGSGRVMDVLINNAGFGLYGQHLSIPWEKEAEMLQLDMVWRS